MQTGQQLTDLLENDRSPGKSPLQRLKSEQPPKLKSPFDYGFTDIGRALRWTDKGRDIKEKQVVSQQHQQE